MKILITSGGTKIPIDTVRDITNMSTGTFGTKIATELLRLGHEVIFVRAKGSKSPLRFTVDFNGNGMTTDEFNALKEEREKWMFRYTEFEYKTFEQYERALQYAVTGENPAVVVLAAAVSDYYVPNPMQGKLRSNDMLTLKLESLPKLINKVKGVWAPDVKLVGFKLLVGSTRSQLMLAAEKSCEENKCDMVVANDLEDIKFNRHKVILMFPRAVPQTYETNESDPDFLAKMVVKHILEL
jgi:phosphopantothenate---cysteine ligase (CTP)